MNRAFNRPEITLPFLVISLAFRMKNMAPHDEIRDNTTKDKAY